MTTLSHFVAILTSLIHFAQPYAQQHGHELTPQQTACLTETIYYEARGEGLDGGIAVAYVVLNRVAESGQTICEVVHERGQFSYYHAHAHNAMVRDADAWNMSAYLAIYTQLGLIRNPIANATFYNTTPMPMWTQEVFYGKLNRHYFYIKKTMQDEHPLFVVTPVDTTPRLRIVLCQSATDPPTETAIPSRRSLRLTQNVRYSPRLNRRADGVSACEDGAMMVKLPPSVPFPVKPTLSLAQVVSLASVLTVSHHATLLRPQHPSHHQRTRAARALEHNRHRRCSVG